MKLLILLIGFSFSFAFADDEIETQEASSGGGSLVGFGVSSSAQVANSACVFDSSNPQIAFLNYITDIHGNGSHARSLVRQACAEFDYMNDNTGEFRTNSTFNFRDRVLGALQSTQIATPRALLMSEEAESERKQNEMRRVHPRFMRNLDEFKRINDPWRRMQRTYEYITSMAEYDDDMATTNPAGLMDTNPVASAGRILNDEPIGVCVHYAALLDFALTYVGGGPQVDNFDVSINVGNIHAWNHVRFETTQNGRDVVIQFDLDATHFDSFTPLSISHWDVALPLTGTKELIMNSCRTKLNCMGNK